MPHMKFHYPRREFSSQMLPSHEYEAQSNSVGFHFRPDLSGNFEMKNNNISDSHVEKTALVVDINLISEIFLRVEAVVTNQVPRYIIRYELCLLFQ